MTRPLEAPTFGSMPTCRTRMAPTCLARTSLARLRTLRFCSALIVCVSLLMILTPSAHGFAMTSHGNTGHGSVVSGGHSAAPSDDGAATHARSYHHGYSCCVAGGDPLEDSGSAHDTCAAACCSGVTIACLQYSGVLNSAETGPPIAIPTSAGRGAIHPPPRRERMT